MKKKWSAALTPDKIMYTTQLADYDCKMYGIKKNTFRVVVIKDIDDAVKYLKIKVVQEVKKETKTTSCNHLTTEQFIKIIDEVFCYRE